MATVAQQINNKYIRLDLRPIQTHLIVGVRSLSARQNYRGGAHPPRVGSSSGDSTGAYPSSLELPAQPIRLLLIVSGHGVDRLAVGVRRFYRNGHDLPVL